MDKNYAIFDMDGTLIDSMGFWKNLATEYLTARGVAEIPQELLERIKPMTMSESAELFRREFGLTGDPEAEMNAMMEEHYREDIPLKPGVAEYLRKLQRRGVRMCVASATAEHLMESCLTRLGVRNVFEFLLSCETVGAAPGEIAVYEDALYAVQTAKMAGFHVVGVYDDSAAGNWKAIEKSADEIILNWEETL